MQKEKVQIKKNFYYYIGKIADIIIYPVLFIALITSFSMFSSNRENKVPILFNHGLVTILSGSMQNSGFYKGDKVVIRVTDTDLLRPTIKDAEGNIIKEGDIIAFYYAKDDFDNIGAKIEDFDNLPYNDSDKIDYTHRKTLKDIQDANARVYFHQIINVYINQEGIRFFQTKGSSNQSADAQLIREDFVVGKYIEVPKALNSVLTFCTTSSGMIVLVVLPLSVLICMQMLTLLEQASAIILEKKTVEKRIRYDSEECVNSNILIELRHQDKYYFYDVIENKEKDDVFVLMWDVYKNSKKKNHIKEYNKAMKAKKIYDQLGRDYYWNYLFVNSNKYSLNRIKKMYVKASNVRYEEIQGLTTKVYGDEGDLICRHWRKGKWM